MLVKSFKVAFSSLEMAQRSILSMLQKTNHDKNRTGNPVQSDGGLTKSVEQNRTGNPVQSDGRLTKSVETNRSEESDQFALMPSVGFVMRWLINVVANAAQREYSF